MYLSVQLALQSKRRSSVVRLLRLWVRIPPGLRMSVYCESYVLSGRGLCDELITRPKRSYRLWCVVVCDLENSRMRRPWPIGGCCAKNKQTNKWMYFICSATLYSFIDPIGNSVHMTKDGLKLGHCSSLSVAAVLISESLKQTINSSWSGNFHISWLHLYRTRSKITQLLIQTHAHFHWLKFIKNI